MPIMAHMKDELTKVNLPFDFDSNGNALTTWQIDGNMVQDGTPTPDAPITPQECGDKTENLFDATIEQGTVRGTDGIEFVSQTRVRSGAIKVRSGNYTVSSTQYLLIVVGYSGGTFTNTIYNAMTGATKTPTFTVPTGTDTIRLVWKNAPDNTDATNIVPSDVENIMLNAGSTAKPYEPYGYKIPITCAGQTQTIYLSEPLRKALDGSGAVDALSFPENVLTRRVDSDGNTLATPTTETVNLPSITPQRGSNTLTVDTTLQPSSVSVRGSDLWAKVTKIPLGAGASADEARVVYAKNGRMVFRKYPHFGFKISKSEDDSDNAVIYTHDAVTMTPAFMDYTNGVFNYGSWANAWFVKDSYPVALKFDGTEDFKLDPADYTKKLDGTSSGISYVLQTEQPSDWAKRYNQYYTLQGSSYVRNSYSSAPTWIADTFYTLTCTYDDGNFMIAFPKVYFKRYEDASYNYVEISDRKINNDWYAYAHINTNGDEVDYIYLPMFKGSIKSSKLRSVPGALPQSETTAQQELDAATACGSRWQFWDHSSRELINDLLVLISKSLDGQTKFGKGQESGYDSSDTTTYGKLNTGSLITKGQFFGYDSSYSEVKVFGMEGFWACRWDRVLGQILDNNVWKVKMTPPYNFTGTNFVTLSDAPVPASSNWLYQISTSRYGSLPASAITSSKRFKDYFYKNASGTRVGFVGGTCNAGSACGPRCVNVNNAASYSSRGVGASPIYK